MSTQTHSASNPAAISRPAPVSRVRFSIAVAAGVYPVLTGLLYGLWPLIGPWPMWGKTLALVPLMAPIMVWGVIPAAHRWLGGWLHPARAV